MGARIAGVGGYLPSKVITNDDLAKTLDTSHEWIITRTALHSATAEAGEFTSHLAKEACSDALKDAGMAAADIDLLILATTTPDHTFPATAVRVQHMLGTGGAAFDMAAVCGGFVFALATADALIKARQARRALVVGAETMSRIVNWSDRGTAVLFGDGAGAFVLEASDDENAGLKGHLLKTDGAGYDSLYVDGGVSVARAGVVRMNGAEVFKRAVIELGAVSVDLLNRCNVLAESVDWVVPHQANIRIIDAMRKRLSLPEDKVYLTVDKHANTSAASVPLAFVDGVRKGAIKRGQLILSQVFAAGFAWGATLFRY